MPCQNSRLFLHFQPTKNQLISGKIGRSINKTG
jgi:hypothetical protein